MSSESKDIDLDKFESEPSVLVIKKDYDSKDIPIPVQILLNMVPCFTNEFYSVLTNIVYNKVDKQKPNNDLLKYNVILSTIQFTHLYRKKHGCNILEMDLPNFFEADLLTSYVYQVQLLLLFKSPEKLFEPTNPIETPSYEMVKQWKEIQRKFY